MNFAIAAALTQRPATASIPALDHRKLTDAAQQFEGMLLQEMLKPMREHGFAQQESEDASSGSGDAGSDTLGSFGTEAMATAIAKGGGLGIAKRIVAQVETERDLRSHVAVESVQPEFQNKTATVLKSPQTAPMN